MGRITVKKRFLSLYRSFIIGNRLALFLLPIKGTKEKAKQKENAVKGLSPSAEGDGGRGALPHTLQAFKKA